MRPSSVRPFAAVVAALAGALLLVGPARAKAVATPFEPQVKELHEIKLLLERADHDYKGHRAEAVKQLGEAIHTLHPGHHANHKAGTGVKAAAKGKREPQALSDAQLRESVKALHAVHKQLEAAGGEPAAKGAAHVHKAIKELEIALKIK